MEAAALGHKWHEAKLRVTDRPMLHSSEDAGVDGRSDLPSPTPTEQLLREIAGVKQASWAQSQEWVRLMASSAAAAEARAKTLENQLAAMASEVASAKGCIADLESIIKEQDQAVASAAGKIAALEDRLQAAHLRAVAKSTQFMELEGRLSQAVASYEEANDRAKDLAKQLQLERKIEQASAAMPPSPKLHDSTEMTPLGANARWAANHKAANPASLSLPSPKVRLDGHSSLDASLCNLSSPAAISPAMGRAKWPATVKPESGFRVSGESNQENQSPEEAAWRADAGGRVPADSGGRVSGAWSGPSPDSGYSSSAISSPGEDSLSGSIQRVDLRPRRGSRPDDSQRRGRLAQRTSLQMSQGPLGKAASSIASPSITPSPPGRKPAVPWVSSVKPSPKSETTPAGTAKKDRRPPSATKAQEQPTKQARGTSLTPGRSRLPSPRVPPRVGEKTEPTRAKEGSPMDQKAAGMPRGVQFLLANEEPCCIPPSRTHHFKPRPAILTHAGLHSPITPGRQPLSPANSNQRKLADTKTSPLSKQASRSKSARRQPDTPHSAIREGGARSIIGVASPPTQLGYGPLRNLEQLSPQPQPLMPPGSAKKQFPQARSPTEDLRDDQSVRQETSQQSPLQPPTGQAAAMEAAKPELQGQGWVHDLYGSSEDPYTPEKVSAVQKGLMKLAKMVSPRLAGQGGTSPYYNLSPRSRGLQKLMMGGSRGDRVKSALVHQFGDTG